MVLNITFKQLKIRKFLFILIELSIEANAAELLEAGERKGYIRFQDS